MRVSEGETILLREGATCRWVRVVFAKEPKPDGTQVIEFEVMDQFGRGRTKKLESVVLGGNAHVESMI